MIVSTDADTAPSGTREAAGGGFRRAQGRPDRAIVTGAAGLLGHHVVDALAAAGWSVTGVDRLDRPVSTAADDWLRIDLADRAAMDAEIGACECLVHCAAIPRPTGAAAETVFATNVGAMYHVLAMAEARQVPRIVYASSFSVLGLPFAPAPVRIVRLPVDEDHPVAPQDVYAVSKWLGEEMLDAWCRRTGGSAVSLRLPWIHTPATFARDVVPRRRTADARLDLWAYIDARDAGEACVAAARASGAGHARLFVSAADTYADEPSAALARRHWPEAVVRAPLDGHASLIDASRAVEMIGFSPSRSWRAYDLSDGGAE